MSADMSVDVSEDMSVDMSERRSSLLAVARQPS